MASAQVAPSARDAADGPRGVCRVLREPINQSAAVHHALLDLKHKAGAAVGCTTTTGAGGGAGAALAFAKAFGRALALGAGFLYWAIVLMRNNNDRAPMETFRYSIVYLGALFLVMLIDHYLFLGVSSTAPIQMTPLSA